MTTQANSKIRNELVAYGRSIFDRGLTGGSTGNISVRTEHGFLMTPTGSSMGTLDPDRLCELDAGGNHIGGDRPTKESVLHLAMYEERPDANAVVHLHSTNSVAVSCLKNIDPTNVLPAITAYYVMRVGTLPLVPYYPPGDIDLAKAVGKLASKHHAVLLAHHGPVVAGTSLSSAVDAIEELEETAKLFLMLKNTDHNILTREQIQGTSK